MLPNNTCPNIDKIIDTIEWTLENKEIREQDLMKCIDILEELRTSNALLRDCAEKTIKELDEIKGEKYALEDKYNDLLDQWKDYAWETTK